MKPMTTPTAATILALASVAGPAQALCGFYVARADTRLFNEPGHRARQEREAQTLASLTG